MFNVGDIVQATERAPYSITHSGVKCVVVENNTYSYSEDTDWDIKVKVIERGIDEGRVYGVRSEYFIFWDEEEARLEKQKAKLQKLTKFIRRIEKRHIKK